MAAVWLLLLVSCLAVLVVLAVELAKHRKRAEQLGAESQQLTARAAALKAENERLSKWKGVADADAKAEELLRTARAALDQAKKDAVAIASEAARRAQALQTKAKELVDGATGEAEEILGSARNRAAEITGTADTQVKAAVSEARRRAKELKDEAQKTLDAATLQAWRITEDAHKRAEEIAGGAYEAMRNAKQYEQTVKAMRNIIDGYGDRYVVPGHSLLDDLAEDVGYTEVGQELEKARDRTTTMVFNDTAAACQYVEDGRRETAIRFVIDAFNGKVDSILSRVKHDNAGTLEQEIRDAFAVVNHNGAAFRDARITEEYLAARLAELRWAATAQYLKLQEREEQRRVKEQIREEEKARKEYERAMKEATKEEEVLKKAMEKAQQQIAQATAEQKAKYEQQLQELTQRLKEAEERSQRALSMAQQTKKGHVYIISNIGSFGENVYKIGLTRRLEPLDRVRELGDSSVPFEFDVHALILSEDAPALENMLHKHLVLMQMNKVNHRKEFFRVDLKQIRGAVESVGVTASWTMTGQATQYRETLAIEKAIQEDPAKKEAWVQRQLELEPVDAQIAEETQLAAGQ